MLLNVMGGREETLVGFGRLTESQEDKVERSGLENCHRLLIDLESLFFNLSEAFQITFSITKKFTLLRLLVTIVISMLAVSI